LRSITADGMVNAPMPISMFRVVLVAFSVLLLAGVLDSTRAQQRARRVFRIGVLHPAFVPSIPSVEGLKSSLKAMGLEEGRDVVYEIRFTRGKPELASVEAAALVKSGVDLLYTDGEDVTRAARQATSAIPIVFVDVGDPVAAGIVASFNRPGGNITGVSAMLTELTPKRLETLKALVPTLRRVWAVYHTDDLSSRSAARKAAEMAAQLRLELLDRGVRTLDELVSTLRGLQPGDGVLAPFSTSLDIPGIILDLQLGNRVPAVFTNHFWVQAGGLVSYGADMSDQGAQAARLVEKILRGAKPRDLPVEATTKIELAINLKAARHLGVTVPKDILLRAAQVFE
jgi:putative ABC transport system substrate-binding protein